ncbi:rhomboid family intramembrane serine protease [Xanthomonas rydalmerensis]|uniref:Rhomboid family intramembrane serine protease n=1 Tax=Xanthomonas rydalmerensis TaxID=3046274 RepID=A0ABZ0JID2_9XANT|nr:rhomboid family intramembrane serine protease [Xanthomonas sp. DM-2023]WOS39566.1 rhomboid family intramembrane serine protease [Xanthomonas sp. DM-2023]WOS43750.1 rhomboid family intramembrane serine protease [Xanthomonas sp. DM-2023]WOS47930.1 rhomboid family intramembrane serine protease [Xanthomonas sp. DM-2023]WOS52109.1 rhomboid family intramembrane serine protease [Xanthomonas sp. DM-2023]WOS56293.1 rhomboid family intramembrane serine protease [Xanthomonas sp. DM-2023]
MLILPLHKPLSRENFPLVTLLLILLNVAVYVGWQRHDTAPLRQAFRYYLDSGLGALEAPAYARYLDRSGQREPLAQLQQVPAKERLAFVCAATLHDVRFVQAMRDGSAFADADARQAWTSLRARYDALLQRVFTLRHVQRSSEWAPARMLGSTFLHADAMHLIGNMLFLLALGTLLEGAIGGWRFLAVYLLGAFGASAASLWWRWGEAGGGLGASGAIAALMGAFCVVWGRRPVRFFYWAAVLFDYVRAPAIALLPLWLGWELYNLLFNGDAGIGFDAHAGGLVVGALLGAVLVATGQTREAFLRDDGGAVADDRWARAQAHLGRMEHVQAGALLDALAAEAPQRFDVAMARYRLAANAGQAATARLRALELLRLAAPSVHEARQQAGVLAAAGDLDPPTRTALFARWMALGLLAEAEALLAQDAVSPREQQAQAWFRLALGHGERQATAEWRRVLEALIVRYPDLPQADKARFLLANA